MNNKNKKILISSLMLLALLLLVGGVTYTALTYINSSDANSINTGRISMSYSEPSNALILENALPMSDTEGLNQTNFFEFTVSSNASTNGDDNVGVTIPYEINLSDIEIDNDKTLLPKDKIKVILTKVVDGLEEQVIEPTIISSLSNSTLNIGSLKVYDTKNAHKNNNGTITTRYRLRAWIDKDFELDNTKTYQYKFRVNVNSNTTPLSLLKVDKIMLEVWGTNKTAMSSKTNEVLRLANEEDGKWVEVLDEKTLTKDDRIRITFIYNNNIKGTAPTLSLKFGSNDATGTVSNGTIEGNKLSYEYTISKNDEGKIAIKDLTGGSIKDETNNVPTVLTNADKESLQLVAAKLPTLSESILGNNNSNVITSGDGLYSTTNTNFGEPSYYYKGNVTNNYVKLPEKSGDEATDALYRIVRINEDGSVRLIRQDEITYNVHYNGQYYFNQNNYNNYKYMYYSESGAEGGTMKTVNDWYTSTIEGTTLDSKVVKSDFCEQAKVKRSPYFTSGNAEMIVSTNDYVPSLKCEEDANGNGPLKMKAGLITMDEVVMVGIPLGNQTNNTNVYLHNGNSFWTMSPAGYYNNTANAWYVSYAGFGDNNVVNGCSRIRPVFSLSSDIQMTGKGTISDPFTPILK